VGESDRTAGERHGVGATGRTVSSEIRQGERIVRLSNLDKPYWPEAGIAKGDLPGYYRDIAPSLLPHLRDRPFTMKRYPDGWQGRPLFRKDVAYYAPAWVERVGVTVTTRDPSPQTRTATRLHSHGSRWTARRRHGGASG
jgi:DNA primase